MKKILWSLILCVFVVSVSAVAADFSGDVGLYSQYINGVGGVAGKNHEPATQGSVRLTATNGVYGEGWLSQSVQHPGFSDTSTNEFDATLGVDKKFAEKWSADAHIAYFDIANPKLMNGVNGDLANAGTTVRYQATPDTRVYMNLEGYHGIGDTGLAGGWRAGLGVRTLVGPMVVDAIMYHNQNFLGHGQFVKLMTEPKEALAKFAGGEIRPTIFLYQPIGEYQNTHSSHIIGAAHITF